MLRAFGHAIVVSQVAARCLRFALAATAVSAIAAKHAEAAGGATKSGLRASVTRQVRPESTRIVDDSKPIASVAGQRQ